MKTMQQWFDEYAVSHQNGFNKLMHWVCVPLIFFSIYGILASIPFDWAGQFFPEGVRPYINLGTILMAGGLIFYLRISFSMFLGMLLVVMATIWGNVYLMTHSPIPLWQLSLGIFVLAWIGQFVGHKVEGAKPSFFKDLQFLMIGPAWLMGFIYRKVGIPY